MNKPNTTPAAASPPGRKRFRAVFALAAGTALVVTAFLGGNYLWHRARFQDALVAERARDFSAARDALSPCLRYWPDDPEVHLLAARVARRSALGGPFAPGWSHEVVTHLKAAEKARPAWREVALEYELLVALDGDLGRVEGHLLKTADEGGPEAPLVWEALARANLDDHRFSRVVRAATSLIGLQPDHALAYFWRGLAYEMTYAADTLTVPDYEKAVELDPANEEFRVRLAIRLAERKRFAEALPHFNDLSARRPHDPAVLLGLATCREGLGGLKEAAVLLDRLVALHPEDGKALAQRGQVALEADRPEEAERWLHRALEKAPREPTAHYNLAQCLQKQGREKEAQEHQAAFERIKADWTKIRELARRAQESPHAASLRCELGVLLLRNGDAEAGVHWLQSALALEPGNEEARKALAEYKAASRRRPAPGRPG
jgi:predicted Zn-dependent protease